MRKNKRKRLYLSPDRRHVKQRISENTNSQREIKARTEETQQSSHTEMHGDGNANVASQTLIHRQYENRDCPHCGTHFTSPEAYQYHKRMKTKNQDSRTIPFKDFKKSIHHIVCPETNCCFSTKQPKNMKVYFGYKYFPPFHLSSFRLT